MLLRKRISPCECIGSWKRFDETSLPNKNKFYSSLIMKDVTDVDYIYAKKVWKGFKKKILGYYHDLHFQHDNVLLPDVFENFENKCMEMYELDPAHFLSAPGLEWQPCLKKIVIKLELLTDVDMLLIVAKGIKGGICHSVHKYAKANNKYMKNDDKNKESSYVQYLDANNLYGWAMSQKLSINGFKWVKDVNY